MALFHVVDGPGPAATSGRAATEPRGPDPPRPPTVLMGSSLGATHRLWEGLAAELSPTRRVVRFDTRGHGRSPVPEAPVTVAELAADVVALADDLGVERFSYVGVSLGGAIGQLLALDHPERVDALVLCSTAPRFGDAATWHERAATVRADGMDPLVGPTRDRWFTASFRTDHPEVVERVMADFAATPVAGYAACCEAMARFDTTDRLGGITTPTLVVAGENDPTAGPDVGQALADGIPGARLVVLPDSAHLAHLAQPRTLGEEVTSFLASAQTQA